MTPGEATALLSVAAAFDNRKPDADAAKAWSVALRDLLFLDCRDAIIEHYRASSEWLMPSVVITRVQRVRNKRIADNEAELTPPPEAREGVAMHEWLAQAKRRLGDGEPAEAISYRDPELKARYLPDLRALMPRPDTPPCPEPEAGTETAPPNEAALSEEATA